MRANSIWVRAIPGGVVLGGLALASLPLAPAGLPALPAAALAGRPATGLPATGLPGASALLTRAPYLTDLTTSSVQVSWATSTQNRGVVQYGPPGNCTAQSVTAAKLGTPITVNGVTEYQNSVAVTGLSASTPYCYRVTTTGASPVDLLGAATPSPQFTTLEPADGTQPLTFDVMDDWGNTSSNGVNDGSVNPRQAAIDAEIASSGAQFLISIGDTAYQGGSQTNYGDLNQTGPYISDVFGPSYWAIPGQDIPVFQGNGDHGQNSTVLHVWPEPAITAASGGVDAMVDYPSFAGTTPGKYPTSYYAFSAGGVRFYVLDAAWGYTNVGSLKGGACGSACAMYQVDQAEHWMPSSPEYQWLAQDLAAHPGGLKFAFFHFPLYSDDATEPSDTYLDAAPGSSGSLEQLLHDNGVDLAFNGHAHDYQRNIAVPGGVTSYVTGGGGGQVIPIGGHGCATTDAYGIGWNYHTQKGTACGEAKSVPPATDAQVYNFIKVSVNGTNVTVTPVNAQGQPFDSQTYSFAPDSTPPSAPGGLTAAQPALTKTVLTWTAATDNIGVSAYDIYRNGGYLATARPGVTSYTDAAASAGVGYTYRVDARDLAGNTTAATVDVNGGSDRDTVFSDGFEAGDMAKWSTVSGTIGAQPALVHTGTYAARQTSTGSPAYAYATVPGSTDLEAQVWVDVVSHATSANFFGFRGGGSIANVYVNGSGKLAVRNNVGLVTTTSTMSIPAGWHLVTLHAIVAGTASAIDVRLDGTPVPGLALTGQNLGTRPITALQLGDTTAGRTYDVAFDDVSVFQGTP